MNCNNGCIILALFMAGLFLNIGVPMPVSGASSMIVTSSGTGIDDLINLTFDNIDRTLAILTINSLSGDSPDGFRLTISSLNNGRLVRQVGLGYANTGNTGNVSDYTMTMVANGNGVLGATAPILPSDNDMLIPVQLDFGTPVTTNTVDREYNLNFTIPGKTSLLAGTFGDVITLTLSDL